MNKVENFVEQTFIGKMLFVAFSFAMLYVLMVMAATA